MQLIRSSLGVGLILLLTQCTVWRQSFITVKGQENTQEILTAAISACMHEPRYTAGMKPGSVFMHTILPGYQISEDNLTFNVAMGNALLSSPTEIEKAYAFSKLVDGLLLLGSEPLADGSLLSEDYKRLLKTSSLQFKKASKQNSLPDNFPVKEITCAKFDDDFFLTFLNPVQFSQNAAWTVVEEKSTAWDSTYVNGKAVRVTIPLYNLSMEICLLKVERPWFKLSYARANVENGKKAYVDAIILARKINLENFSESKLRVTVSKSGKQYQNVKYAPTSKISSSGPVIIGYVYRII
jgi:hypothetical protein